MNYCKLTDQDLRTYNDFQWELEKTETIDTKGGELCSNDFFHYYTDPLLAVILNPIHACIENPRIFLVKPSGETKDDNGLKMGSKELTLVEEIELPEITKVQKIAFGILCALEVCKEPDFIKWATGWLDGSDRSTERAAAYSAAAYYAAYAARSAANIDLISLAKKSLTYN
jgi:hypothetical protein